MYHDSEDPSDNEANTSFHTTREETGKRQQLWF